MITRESLNIMSSLYSKTKIGMIWNVLEKISVQGVSFILNIILARLLSPHDYGTIGMLTIFLTFSNVFIDSGFSRALIQKQDRSEKDFSTTLIFNFLISIFIYVSLYIFSPAIAAFYNTPELIGLQRIFFLVIILNSLTVVQSAQLQIRIDFKKIAIINFISVVVSGIGGIIGAFYGLGAGALVIQSLLRSLTSTISFWLFSKWIPKTGFSIDSFKNLFGFGSKLLASGLLATLLQNIDSLFIGKIYTPASLGYYTRAQQFPELTSGTLAGVLNNTTFPLLASLQNDKEQLVKTFKKLISLTSILVIPAMIGIALLSNEIILVVLGEKWVQSADLLFWLSLSYIFTPFSYLNMNILNAIGRSDLFLKVDISKVPIILLTMIITFPISLKAVVIGKFVASFIYFYMNGFLPGKFYQFGAFKQLLCTWKTLIATTVMTICIITLKYFILSNSIKLFLCTFLGIISYFLILIILKEDNVTLIINKIKHKRN